MDHRIKLIRPCKWEEVFLEWYKDEGEAEHWQKLAKERGFASWADWRINGYARRFNCEKAAWGFYEITDPAEVVSGWFGGPFRTWIARHYGGDKTKSFSEIADSVELINNAGMQSRVADYPADSIISALELADGRVFVIEGMHRAAALAIGLKQNKPMPKKLIFAIGKSSLNELPPVGMNG